MNEIKINANDLHIKKAYDNFPYYLDKEKNIMIDVVFRYDPNLKEYTKDDLEIMAVEGIDKDSEIFKKSWKNVTLDLCPPLTYFYEQEVIITQSFLGELNDYIYRIDVDLKFKLNGEYLIINSYEIDGIRTYKQTYLNEHPNQWELMAHNSWATEVFTSRIRAGCYDEQIIGYFIINKNYHEKELN